MKKETQELEISGFCKNRYKKIYLSFWWWSMKEKKSGETLREAGGHSGNLKRNMHIIILYILRETERERREI